MACAAAALLTGCFPDHVSEIEAVPLRLILYGRVLSHDGAAIPGARIDISYHPSACSVVARTRTSTTTADDGRYRTVFETPAGDVGCVKLQASASGFAPDSVSRANPPFRLSAPYDSAQTNFTLRR